MSDKPFFSIIIPTYNRAHLISRAIKSVIDQIYINWELLIIDDESTDKTSEVVKGFNDKRISYIFKKNNERSAARNTGIDAAKGNYICFLDSDDYYLENHLSEFHKVIEKNDYSKSVFYCNTYQDIAGILTEVPDIFVPAENNVEMIIQKIIGCPRLCLHNQILREYKFNETIFVGEDTELLSRILKKYPLISNNKSTVVFTSHQDRTVHLSNEIAFLNHIKMLKKIIHEDNEHYISSHVRKEVLSSGYFNLGRHYEYKKKKIKAVLTIIRSILIQPHQRIKEKIFIIINNIPIVNQLLKLKRLISKI